MSDLRAAIETEFYNGNLTEEAADRLRAILATPAPDTDALAERVLRATRFAESMALTERVRGHFDNERAWLDMLIILTPAQPAEPTQSDAGEVGDGE